VLSTPCCINSLRKVSMDVETPLMRGKYTSEIISMFMVGAEADCVATVRQPCDADVAAAIRTFCTFCPESGWMGGVEVLCLNQKPLAKGLQGRFCGARGQYAQGECIGPATETEWGLQAAQGDLSFNQ